MPIVCQRIKLHTFLLRPRKRASQRHHPTALSTRPSRPPRQICRPSSRRLIPRAIGRPHSRPRRLWPRLFDGSIQRRRIIRIPIRIIRRIRRRHHRRVQSKITVVISRHAGVDDIVVLLNATRPLTNDLIAAVIDPRNWRIKASQKSHISSRP
jgi:hypothetical protein